MKARFFIIPCIVLAAAACQKEEDKQTETRPERPETGSYTLIVEAVKDVDTKALELTDNGTALDAYWVSGEKVSVYLDGVYKGYLTATPTAEKSKTATLSGEIDGISDEATLQLLSPGRDDQKWDYTGQTGAAPTPEGDLSKRFDYALATVTVNGVSGTTITTTGATFTNQQSIYRFGFRLNSATGDYVDPVDFIVSASGNTIVQSFNYENSAWTPVLGYNLSVTTPTTKPTDHFYYLSILNQNTTSNERYTFSLTGPNSEYLTGYKDVDAGHLDQGKFISAKNIVVSQPSFAPADGNIPNSSAVL